MALDFLLVLVRSWTRILRLASNTGSNHFLGLQGQSSCEWLNGQLTFCFSQGFPVLHHTLRIVVEPDWRSLGKNMSYVSGEGNPPDFRAADPERRERQCQRAGGNPRETADHTYGRD